jgi:hypothetical protein
MYEIQRMTTRQRQGARVIGQARRRVLDGEQVPTSEKIYSIFEPHTDLIKRGKVRAPVEFGHKVFLAESAKGLVTQYEVLRGNPADEVHVAPSLKRHRRIFRRSPALYGADRGFFSEDNIAVCVRGGVATRGRGPLLVDRFGVVTAHTVSPVGHARRIAGLRGMAVPIGVARLCRALLRLSGEVRRIEVVLSGNSHQREQGIAPGVGQRRPHAAW